MWKLPKYDEEKANNFFICETIEEAFDKIDELFNQGYYGVGIDHLSNGTYKVFQR
jgi:hypothetical protein